MKTAAYKLTGSDVPEYGKGLVIELPEQENHEDVLAQTDGGEKDADKAAQAAFDITKQRLLRGWSASEDASKFVLETAGEGADDADKAEALRLFLQERIGNVVDGVLTGGYRYGSRVAGTGEKAAVKEAAKNFDAVKAAAADDPELAAKLRALNIPGYV